MTCPQGKFCLRGTEVPFDCPVGTFSNHSGLQRSDQCTNCTCGMYCSLPGLITPKDVCDAKYFCKSRAEDPKGKNGIGGECIPGHYCPPNSCTPLPCKVRLFSNCFYKSFKNTHTLMAYYITQPSLLP